MMLLETKYNSITQWKLSPPNRKNLPQNDKLNLHNNKATYKMINLRCFFFYFLLQMKLNLVYPFTTQIKEAEK